MTTNLSLQYVRRFFFLFVLAGLSGFIAAASARAQTDSCVTSSCHASMGKAASVHNPVKEGMCAACHQAVLEPGKKTKHPGNLAITLMQQGAALCAMCHEPKNKKKVVHGPILGGDCTSCHNPHQSANKGMLREAMPQVCVQCHPDSIVKNTIVHPPVAGGDCTGCHDVHQSDNPRLLMQKGNSLCFMCHPDKEEQLKKKGAVVHMPVKDSCVTCHNPHSAQHKAMLTNPVPDLCGQCHPNQVTVAAKSAARHTPVIEGNKCLTCHDIHVAAQRNLLPKPEKDLCLLCHAEEFDTPRGKIRDMKTHLESSRNGHGPVRNGNCSSCHNAHGSDFFRLLVKYYPPELYTSYADAKYALCFSCHKRDAFTDRRTSATGFRDDKQNLHFVHVNRAAKGRTCRLCHDAHASGSLPHHLVETFAFSGWDMPLNFSATPKGGSCVPGCHGEKSYSR